MSTKIGYIPGNFAQQFGVDTLRELAVRAGSNFAWTTFSLEEVEKDLQSGGTSIAQCDAVVMGYQNVAQWADKDDQAMAASNGDREGGKRRSGRRGTLRAEMPFCIVGRNGCSVVQNSFHVIIRTQHTVK